MDRRQFVKGSLTMAGGGLLPAKLSAAPPTENLKVQYIRPATRAFEIPPYRGDRYEDRVPDTLDIAELGRVIYPPAKPEALETVSRSKRLVGVADAAPRG